MCLLSAIDLSPLTSHLETVRQRVVSHAHVLMNSASDVSKADREQAACPSVCELHTTVYTSSWLVSVHESVCISFVSANSFPQSPLCPLSDSPDTLTHTHTLELEL